MIKYQEQIPLRKIDGVHKLLVVATIFFTKKHTIFFTSGRYAVRIYKISQDERAREGGGKMDSY